MCSHCLSLDFSFLFVHWDVTHSCVIVFKNRMIVSWTIKGNDVFPRFPQGRMISAECVPLNNPNHTENKITHRTTSTLGSQSISMSANIYWSFLPLPVDYIISLYAHSCPDFMIPSKDYYFIPFVTLPNCISTSGFHPLDTAALLCLFPRWSFLFLSKLPHTKVFDLRNAHFVWPSTMMYSHPQRQASSCVLHFPPTSQEEFLQHICRKQISSFILLHSMKWGFIVLVLKYNFDFPHFQVFVLSFVSTFFSIITLS